MKKNQKGFSLIELLIVVAIILIIAAIAIPNLLRSKMAANEAAAVGALRTIITAQVTYYSTYNTGYATTFQALSGAAGAAATCAASQLLDPTFNAATPARQGYNFTLGVAGAPAVVPATACNGVDDQTFEVEGAPITVGTTGQRSFCDDQAGAIYFDATGATHANGGSSCAADGWVNPLGN
ncbi:MAG TPA: prepilin-type N-terminal cleavage/methylation domain-containing protein [Candidatus Acidoferrales bacterium]|nr:prepilin-type N-terminal cleavage/methylation domain-containing protein [Candidatus Acidoferrales bacterium]